jgi:hypothetical protein
MWKFYNPSSFMFSRNKNDRSVIFDTEMIENILDQIRKES